jgi:hypothetical protein
MLGVEGQCDHLGCGAVRRDVNNWYVTMEDEVGVRVMHWDKCSPQMLKGGRHWCGLPHALIYISSVLGPSELHSEQGIKLTPPLNRDGSSNIITVKEPEL